MIDFGRRRSLSGSNGQFRPSPTDFWRYQPREKEEKGETRDPTLLSRSRSSPAGFSTLRRENFRRSREEENDVSSPRASSSRELLAEASQGDFFSLRG
ncbi:hypothetical protein B296_00042644 [Ensete ventricosum]|uniref:Uncharacterized protein n=1 Tax=Ensete ventricosum TaxID=4639 RepID=A0A426XI61_ENSVE|nr:hypothetical protein B296_00042644 [Ensete ventricosum]